MATSTRRRISLGNLVITVVVIGGSLAFLALAVMVVALAAGLR